MDDELAQLLTAQCTRGAMGRAVLASANRRLLAFALVTVAVFSIPLSASSAAVSFDALLKDAEAARSSNSDRFKADLAQLNAKRSTLTPGQQEHLLYLNAYDAAFRGDFAGAIAGAQELVRTTHDVAMRFRAGALAVNIFAINGQYGQGLRQLDQTLSLIDQIHDPDMRQLGYVVAATLYNQVGQYELGQRYAELAMPGTQRLLCFANFAKFDAMLHLDSLPSDDQPLVAAIQQCEGVSEHVMAGFQRVILARKWAAQGRRDQAIELLQAFLPQANVTQYSRLISEFSAELAELKLAAGDVDGAETNAKAAIQHGKGALGTPPMVSAYGTLSQVALHRNQPLVALSYYKQYSESRLAALEDVKARELAYHLVRQESLQKNQQIASLSRQNSLMQLQQQVDQQATRQSHLLMLFFALMATTISYWAYRTKRMQMSVKRMAESDALTGISNRHHFNLKAAQTLARCKVGGEPVSVLMFDLDYFKAINDKFGHSTGDWVLKRVAAVCVEMCREIDHFGRVGGEEFAILLRGYDLMAATRMAEECRWRLSRIDSSPSGHSFPISASFGVTSTIESGHDLGTLLSHADLMLYRAKREGRNRVRAYAPDTSAELTGADFGAGPAISPPGATPG
jgi:diguanylate cyclase (GGDEF)-like protein